MRFAARPSGWGCRCRARRSTRETVRGRRIARRRELARARAIARKMGPPPDPPKPPVEASPSRSRARRGGCRRAGGHHGAHRENLPVAAVGGRAVHRQDVLRGGRGAGRALLHRSSQAGDPAEGGTMKPEDAEEYTQSLGQIVAGSWRQIALAKRLGVPQALGLSTEGWVKERLGGYVKMSIPERQDAVKNLTDDNFSLRETAEIIGVSLYHCRRRCKKSYTR